MSSSPFTVNERVLVFFQQRLFEAKILKVQLFEQRWWRFYVCYLVKDPPKWREKAPQKQIAATSRNIANTANLRTPRMLRNVSYQEKAAEGWSVWSGWEEWVGATRVVKRTRMNVKKMKKSQSAGGISWLVERPEKEEGLEDPIHEVWGKIESELGVTIPSSLLMLWIEDKDLSLHIGQIVHIPAINVIDLLQNFDDTNNEVGDHLIREFNKLFFPSIDEKGNRYIDSPLLYKTEHYGYFHVLQNVDASTILGAEHLLRVMVTLGEYHEILTFIKDSGTYLERLFCHLEENQHWFVSTRDIKKQPRTSKLSSVSHRRVGLLYDERMCKHKTPYVAYHDENPDRILSIWKKLESSDIIKRCVAITAKEADEDQLALVHSESHISLIKDISFKTPSQRKKIAKTFDSIYFNEGTSESASLAAGSVIEVAEKVVKGELNSAFAIVRPPGHHAEADKPMGFCMYNNVAIAASFLRSKPELGVEKVLIVDWDVHHGNGIQNKFYADPHVLYFSVHRHDRGFFPGGNGGSYKMTGKGPGVGYNINVPWENARCGDADYIAVWDSVLIPVAKEFDPDLIIISAGFDAAIGDPIGGCCVSPDGYALMLNKLMTFAGGKIVMALEGGYNPNSIAESTLACLHVLLGDKPIPGSPQTYPFKSTWKVIRKVRNALSKFWPVLAKELPKDLTNKTIP